MSELKPFLADVPVRVNIWIRPECQKKQFEVLRQARPSVLFLISDGGRNETEWAAIRENRALFDDGIDWDCKVYKIYEDKNNGLYTMSKKGTDLIWSTVDRCIFLEDDYVPSVSYFAFCAELLEKYKDDERIQAICGMNHCGKWEKASADYFFADEGSIWGMASWKRSHESRDPSFSYSKDPYTMELLREQTKNDKGFRRVMEGYAHNDRYGGHAPGGEFYHRLEIYAQHRLYIIPTRNMICNIGCTADSAHAAEYKLLPKGIRKIFNMKTYELEMPIKHPSFVIPDTGYSKARARIMGVGHPLVRRWRSIESALLALRYKGLGGVFAKFKKMVCRRKKMET
ncbi:MAG: hemolysin activation protein [Clostridia bacterium]|nr:hemolysin activation protein [Clostridia bacterium]